MNGYFQLEVQSEGVFVKIYPPTEELERQVQELTATACRQRDFLNSFAHETR